MFCSVYFFFQKYCFLYACTPARLCWLYAVAAVTACPGFTVSTQFYPFVLTRGTPIVYSPVHVRSIEPRVFRRAPNKRPIFSFIVLCRADFMSSPNNKVADGWRSAHASVSVRRYGRPATFSAKIPRARCTSHSIYRRSHWRVLGSRWRRVRLYCNLVHASRCVLPVGHVIK